MVVLFAGLAVVLSIMASRYEEGWRRVVAINTTGKAVQVGVEDEDGEGWSAELVPPGSSKYFKVRPGRYRALVVDEDGRVVRRGQKLVELAPDDGDTTSEDLVFVDARGEGTYAIVDAYFLYETRSGLGEAIRNAMNQGRPTLIATLPASELMQWRNERNATLVLPSEELPSEVRRGTTLYVVRPVPKSATTKEEIIAAVVDSLKS